MQEFDAALSQADERLRLAQALHETVGRRLLALGLYLAGTRDIAGDGPAVEHRLTTAIEQVDEVLHELRRSVFGLANGQDLANRTVSATLVDRLHEATALLGFAPELHLSGPVDGFVGEWQRQQLFSVLREAMLNVASHSKATWACIEVSVRGNMLMLHVADDGVGPPEAPGRGQGLRMIAAVADELDGTFTFVPRAPHGTTLRWHVPVEVVVEQPPTEGTADACG